MIKRNFKWVSLSGLGRLTGKNFSRLASTEEFFDSKEVVDKLAQEVADKLTRAGHAIAFVGAGLSTKSGIPDYRSGYQTVLETGPGKWESEENKAKYEKTAKIRKSTEAWPNDGHRALSALVQKGFIKFVVSQNVDGLLTRAGVPVDNISELHGNIYTELCTCGEVYWRDFSIPTWASNRNHLHGGLGRL